MKKLFITTVIALAASSGVTKAQSIRPANSPFIFPEFNTGTVYQKNGATLEASLNYNTITEEMMFDQNGTKMVLDQVDNIDSIVIQNAVLVPAKKAFLEKLTQTPVAIYAEYRSKMVKGDQTNVGTNNDISAAAGVIKPTAQKPDKYDLKWPSPYVTSTQIVYWAKNGADYTTIANEAAFEKLFPGKESAIAEYIKSNSIKWGKEADMIKLTQFANQK